MALNCQFTVSVPSMADGQTVPIETLTLTVSNPGTSAISVTGVDLQFSDRALSQSRPGMAPPLPPVTQGQSLSIGAGATVVFGPYPLAIWTPIKLALANLITPAQPQNTVQGTPVFVGGIIYGSDGSANVAGAARVLITSATTPLRSFLGGIADFTASDCATLIPVVA